MDAIHRETLEPCLGTLCEVERQVLYDEEVVICPACSTGETEVLQPHDRVGSLEYLTMFDGARKCAENGVCWILFVNACVPQASRLGLCWASRTLGC
jgi:hypothetical protein